MSSAADHKIKLDGYWDWDAWNAIFISRASFLWERIDPEGLAAGRHLVLTRPVKPDLSRYYKGEHTTSRDLYLDTISRDMYFTGLAEFKVEDRAVMELKLWVAETVSKRHFSALCVAGEGISMWYDNLRDKFAGDPELRYVMAEARFKAALEGPASPVIENVMAWLDEWEYAIDGAQLCAVPLASNPEYLWTAFSCAVNKAEELQGWHETFKRANEEALANSVLNMRAICNSLRCALIREGTVDVGLRRRS
ncbi:hypothetical protein C8A05DRAFT_32059 [Staphylotrichum tortipilum]|uniref:Uncharacterized protein n=1 Tax=Staphylotrichum tortipilum TaxID=2831512 RepID=A0AAN6MNJ2_9PEZI|nr:hypothetical protein C8A05DRAFT_32059 [Staphylotrichum longicolle]